jgi:hypothetical protein
MDCRLIVLPVLIGTVLGPAAASAATSQVTTFRFTGGEQTYTVPPGLDAVTIVATGAAGGGPSSVLPAGRGAVVSGIVPVSPGEVLYVLVGGIGGHPVGGFNGGGRGATNTNVRLSEFGGGGASDVRLVPSSAAGSLESRVLVAAGGGGSATPAAAGGDAGAVGGSSPGSSVGGGAGTQTAGGAGGCNALLTGCGGDGSLGVGGAGGVSGTGANAREGAGGGGGLFGGGGGAGVLDGSVGGGGGGSSLVPAGGALTLATVTTPPSVVIATRRPDNHFTVSSPRLRSDGRAGLSVTVPGPGSIDVLETAWDDNVAKMAVLEPAPHRFVFARAHQDALSAGELRLSVAPNRRGTVLVHHHRYRVTLRVWVTYTPIGGPPRSIGMDGLHLGR